MNLLLDKLPQDYNGIQINTDFRYFIMFELLMQDNELNMEEKAKASFDLFFNKKVDLNKGLECMLWFYRCGKEKKNSTQKEKKKKNKFIAMNLMMTIYIVHFYNNII